MGNICLSTCCFCCIHTRQHLWATSVGIHVASVAFTRGNIYVGNNVGYHVFYCIHINIYGQHVYLYMLLSVAFTRGNIMWTTMSAYMLLSVCIHHEATFVGNNVGIHVCYLCIHTRQHLWTIYVGIHVAHVAFTRGNIMWINNVGIHVASVAFTEATFLSIYLSIYMSSIYLSIYLSSMYLQCLSYMLLSVYSHEATSMWTSVGYMLLLYAFTRGNICGQQCRHTCCFCCIHTRQHLWTTMSAYMCSCCIHTRQHLWATMSAYMCSYCIHTRQHLWATMSAYMLLLLHSHEATFVDNNVGIHVASVAFTRGNICGQQCRHTCCFCCIHTRQHLWATMSAYMLLLLHSHEATFVGNNVGIHVASVAFTRGNICGQQCRHTCCFCCIHTRQHLWATMLAYMLLLLHSHEATFVGNNVGIHVFLLHSHEATFVGNNVGILVASVAFTRGNICGQQCRHTCCFCCIHTRQHLWTTMSAYMCSCCIHTRQHLWATMSAYMLLLLHSHEATFLGNNAGIHVASVAFTRSNICGQQCRHTCCFCCIHTRQHLWATMSAYMLLMLHSHEATFVGNNVGIHVASVAFTRGNICGQQYRHTCGPQMLSRVQWPTVR